MAEYIGREAFLEDVEKRYCLSCKGTGKDYNGLKCRACWVDDMCGDIIGAPTVDAVPVVRCTDCVHSYGAYLCGGYCTYCDYLDCVVQPDFYCADGKRKENDYETD